MITSSISYHLSTLPKANHAQKSVIVVYKEVTNQSTIAEAENDVTGQSRLAGGKITQRYTAAQLGLAAELPDSCIQTLSVHPYVDYVEDDSDVTAC
ncbi:MAG: hypothetical protein J3R72DRAFT_493522 [Linnemannia gamsii]|nr:MAG: hypothetical protein J3R72DRAFT_493522 [Linnemannia gamsii]